MSNQPFPGLDITGQWGRLNDTIIALVDCVPDDKMRWSPREDLWSFRRIILHTVTTRDGWLGSAVKDGGLDLDDADAVRSFATRVQSKADMHQELRRSWERLQRFLSDPAKLSKVYEGNRYGQAYSFSGHWVAFHLLEHDIHHRADIFHYLALLGIEHPDVGTP